MKEALIKQVLLPSDIRIGGGAILQTGSVLQKLGLINPLIVTDKTLIELGHVTTLTTILDQNKISWSLFDKVIEDPTDECLLAGLEFFSSGSFDCVIGFGGGSSMDVAKAISAMSVNIGHVREYKPPAELKKCGLPIILLPTTGGTGAECTKWAVITDSASNEKYNLSGPAFVAKAAVIDWKLTLTKPARLTADTAVDSLTHAIEAFVSRKASPFTDTLALSAMQLIANNVLNAFADPENCTAREALMLGASQAGIAFSNASVALVHGMSRPIGANFHVSHGLSNAILLPSITEFSIDYASKRYARCAVQMGWASDSDNDGVACKKLVDNLFQLNETLRVPSLRQLIGQSEIYFPKLKKMAKQAIDSGSPQNNPRIPSLTEIIKLYEKLW